MAYSLGGMPAQVTFSGVVMDVDRMVTNVEEKANCYEGYVAFNRASGMRNSAYEHQIPEQLFSTDTEQAEGVSTAKALAVAMAQGQRIYRLTQSNAAELANITIDDGARTEIQQALNLGLEVTVHQSPITVNGWQGSGYAIVDPTYGVGAYKITGGVSGGFLVVLALFSFVFIAMILSPYLSLVSVSGALLIAAFGFWVQGINKANNFQDFNNNNLTAALGLVIAITGLLLAPAAFPVILFGELMALMLSQI